ncbi:MAG: xanthine dehydrogenase family protein molybdopterin-binding subunit, partial [Candidatus Eiseniibacteriota bacterium]
THQNRPPMADTDEAHRDDVAPEGGSPFRPLYDDRILFNRQPIALVLAEDWETARFAASLVRVEYEKAAFNTDFEAARGRAYIVEKPERPRGDAAKAYQAAEIRHDAEYSVPRENHNPMELYAATTLWHGDGKITVYDKTQGVQNVQRYLCSALKLKPENVTVVAPYVGGAFGSGLRPQYECVLATLGALALKRSVRLVLTRAELYVLGYRPASIEHLALGANRGGMLESVTHEAIAVTSDFEAYSRNDTGWSALLYKSPNARYVHKLVALDLPTSCDMRAPGAATGVYGLECAMDELAVALKMDPLELRLITYSELDQNQNLPYTSKKLRECYQAGARAFGWDKRNPEPRSMRDGKTLVGWGMATGVWEALQLNHDIRIVLTANGHAEVSCATMDIGTGTYTIMAQVAAEMLGLPLEHVSVLLGDSTLPPAPVEGGSWGAASVANGIAAAAGLVRNDLLRLAQDMPQSPLAGMKPGDVMLTGGTIASRGDPSRAVAIGEAMRHGRVERIEHQTNANFQEDKTHARNTHSAVFVEVKVDEQLGVVRVTRVVSAVAAGRILNTKTAHSQIMGSVVWGIGMALHEEALTDNRFGRVMNADIAEYHVPVNADIQKIDVIFVDEPDALINPLGVKGLGEIGIVGVAAAVANAVYHATGKRVRDLPITLDKLLA